MKTETEKYLVKLAILSTIQDDWKEGEIGGRTESDLRSTGLYDKADLKALLEGFAPYGAPAGVRDGDDGGYILSADWMADEDENELSKRGLLEWKFRGKKALRMEVEIFFEVIQIKTAASKLAENLGVDNWS